jgi:hypothetical protein
MCYLLDMPSRSYRILQICIVWNGGDTRTSICPALPQVVHAHCGTRYNSTRSDLLNPRTFFTTTGRPRMLVIRRPFLLFDCEQRPTGATKRPSSREGAICNCLLEHPRADHLTRPVGSRLRSERVPPRMSHDLFVIWNYGDSAKIVLCPRLMDAHCRSRYRLRAI